MHNHWPIAIMLAAGLNAHAAARADACSVDVHLIIGVALPPGMLMDASRKAIDMFREIGVNLRLRMGKPARDQSDSCGAPIIVQIENAAGYDGPARAMAYALPYRESGTCIHMFLDRVTRDRTPASANALLAHVMVHEITHVLELTERHSGDGVMKAVWSDQDYQRMSRHPLQFAPEDVEKIRQGLSRRVTHASAE
jgi:hypothetical protein